MRPRDLRLSTVPLAALIALLPIALAGAPAGAETCLDQVRELSKRYDVSDNPPKATTQQDGASTSDKLARSGGVLEPPPVRDNNVIAPPSTQAYRMPTTPDVKPKDPAAKGPDRTALQAALVAARSQAERGNEEGCREALAKAKIIIARAD